MLAAQKKGWKLDYVEQEDLMMYDGVVYATASPIRVFNDSKKWFELSNKIRASLTSYDVIFMRVDPPVNTSYLHTTQLLDFVAEKGVLVVNPPRSLRDLNEKVFSLHFPDLLPPHLLSADMSALAEFHQKMGKIVLKPLDGMGGEGLFLLKENDLNARSAIENLTNNGNMPVIAQAYINVLKEGDKRVFLFNGEPYPQMLIRLPRPDDFRANLAAGGSYKVEDLGASELKICARVKQKVKEHKLLLVGLDIIGKNLTEINITSPTGMVEIAKQGKENPVLIFLDLIEEVCARK